MLLGAVPLSYWAAARGGACCLGWSCAVTGLLLGAGPGRLHGRGLLLGAEQLYSWIFNGRGLQGAGPL